ncbi:MAG: FAD-dependent oxidoreductase [Candidatus Saccharibacteria bacterium]|nr:FAD-dependent oxidoreductase [Pseudorhodobacter sp.]
MPFETRSLARRIAVIGGGISGMAAAHLLAKDNMVVLYEAEPRLGGHARTVLAGRRGDQPVDTGFIVFNKVNYPNLVALFDRLQVPVVESNMGFGASIQGGRLEYALASLDTVFAQRRNLASPRFLRMLRDIVHFNKHAAALVKPGMSMGDLLSNLGTGTWFRDFYILPISGAIWSTPLHGIMDFPAATLIRFFENHALMSVTGQHQWYTVQGGSVQYVSRLQASLVQDGVDIRVGTAIAGVRRAEAGVMLRAFGGEWEHYDEVIFATHSDDSLRLLADPTPTVHAALSAVQYQANTATLHADAAQMPRSRRAWASWVYTEPAGPRPDRIDLTYWMNSLQPIPADDPLFVTLNHNRPIAEHLIHDTTTFRHPVFDTAAIAAQQAIRRGNGEHGMWFCGAWMRHGFHEDGFASAVEVVDALRSRALQSVAA